MNKGQLNDIIGWSSQWHYIKLEELIGLFSNYKDLKFKTVGVLGAFRKTEEQRQFLVHIDSIIEKVVPQSYRYIMIGIAEKQIKPNLKV